MNTNNIRLLKNEQGFTLIEIIAVLVILGILAAVAIPKYMDIAEEARFKAANGQVAEVKGRLSTALAGHMIKNDGTQPTDGAALVTYANTVAAAACPTASTVEGDFTFSCSGASGSKSVTVTVTHVQGKALTTAQTGTYSY